MDQDLLSARFAELRALRDGWDSDPYEAPSVAPSPEALERAERIAREHLADGEVVDSIDPDVLGGVAIWIGMERIGIMNDGSTTRTGAP